MITNIIISLVVLILVLLSSFALFLPLWAVLKDKKMALRYAIPVSISIEMIIGYIFYCFTIARYFPIFYLILVLGLNLVAFFKLKRPNPFRFSFARPNLISVVVFLIVASALVYTRYYDGFSFISPGGNDAYNHIVFVKDLLIRGYLSNGFYAPGFHLFMMPIAKIVSVSYLYRFAGGALGLLTVLATFLLFADRLKDKSSKILLIALFSFPLFNALTLQTIQFFSSAITFISLGTFISLVIEEPQKKKQAAVIMLISAVALAVNVPYFFISLIPALALLLIITLIATKSFPKVFRGHLSVLSLMLIAGFTVSFIHVYVMSGLLKRYDGFPNIPIAAKETVAANSSLVVEESGKIGTGELAGSLGLPSVISSNKYLAPITGAAYDLVRIKDIRPATSLLGLGGYLWIAFSVFLLAYSLRKKNKLLLVIAVFSIVIGISTQTGFLEINTYRGRSGWYLLYLMLIGAIVFTDQFISAKNRKIFIVLAALLPIAGFIFPPKFYRVFYEQEFIALKKIADEYPGNMINLISQQRQLPVVSTKINKLKTEPESLVNSDTVLVIEKTLRKPDPVLAQAAVSSDKNSADFNKRFEDRENENEQVNKQILSSPDFSNYRKIIEDKDFIIYSNFK